jgi:hypothetical protein
MYRIHLPKLPLPSGILAGSLDTTRNGVIIMSIRDIGGDVRYVPLTDIRRTLSPEDVKPLRSNLEFTANHFKFGGNPTDDVRAAILGAALGELSLKP